MDLFQFIGEYAPQTIGMAVGMYMLYLLINKLLSWLDKRVTSKDSQLDTVLAAERDAWAKEREEARAQAKLDDERWQATLEKMIQIQEERADRVIAVERGARESAERRLDESQAQFLAYLKDTADDNAKSRQRLADSQQSVSDALLMLADNLAKNTQATSDIRAVQQASHQHTHNMLDELTALVRRQLESGKLRHEEVVSALNALLEVQVPAAS